MEFEKAQTAMERNKPMNEMNTEKVERFLLYLTNEIERQREDRRKLDTATNGHLAYECKLMANQTEMIKRMFLKILDEKV